MTLLELGGLTTADSEGLVPDAASIAALWSNVRLAVIDIASGGWMTLSKRALRALHAAHSRPTLPLLQLLVTNRCVPPAAPRAAASWSRHAATWPPLQPSSLGFLMSLS